MPTETFVGTKGREKGQWWPLQDGDKHTVSFICPKCGGQGMFSKEHTIDPDGTVHNSVICGYGCGWHVMLKLEGWKDE